MSTAHARLEPTPPVIVDVTIRGLVRTFMEAPSYPSRALARFATHLLEPFARQLLREIAFVSDAKTLFADRGAELSDVSAILRGHTASEPYVTLSCSLERGVVSHSSAPFPRKGRSIRIGTRVFAARRANMPREGDFEVDMASIVAFAWRDRWQEGNLLDRAYVAAPKPAGS